MLCLQSINSFKHDPTHNAFSIAYDGEKSCLVVGDFGVLKWGVAVNPKTEGTSHDTAISDVVYNEPFNLVISADDSSTVRVWDAITGKPVYFFTEAHGRSKITALTLDNLGRRLVTGAQDGSVKVWNFSTGVCLQNCIPTGNAEVAGVIYARDPLLKAVVAGGWSRRITLWPDVADDTREGVEATQEMEGQQDDILCIALAPPHSVASGSYDGTIVIHNILSGITKHTFRIGGLERLPVNERAVEKVTFLCKKLGIPLLSYHADGKIRLWNVSRANAQVVAEVNGRLPVSSPDQKPADMTCMQVDPMNHHLFTGDASGMLAIWDLRGLDATVPSSYRSLVVTKKWAAHSDNLTQIAYADNHQTLITASVDSSLRMWDLEGNLIGTFGSKTWNLRGVPEEAAEEAAGGGFFITEGAVADAKKKAAKHVSDGSEETPRLGDSKLPPIASAASARLKGKQVDRIGISDTVVSTWLTDKKHRVLSGYDPDKRESHRGVGILKKKDYEDIPYLHRHKRVGVAFPEMTRYGRFRQLEQEREREEREAARRERTG